MVFRVIFDTYLLADFGQVCPQGEEKGSRVALLLNRGGISRKGINLPRSYITSRGKVSLAPTTY
jgi:hypothetical protein